MTETAVCNHFVEGFQVGPGAGFDDIRADSFAVKFTTSGDNFHRNLSQCVFPARNAAYLKIFELCRNPQDSFHRAKDGVDRAVTDRGVSESLAFALQFESRGWNGSAAGRCVEADDAPLFNRSAEPILDQS